jgi:hypothetical protein
MAKVETKKTAETGIRKFKFLLKTAKKEVQSKGFPNRHHIKRRREDVNHASPSAYATEWGMPQVVHIRRPDLISPSLYRKWNY